MDEIQRNRLLEHLIAAMTSGIPQKGGQYHLPESLAIEYGRLCYNQAVKDMVTLFRLAKLGQEGSDLVDRIQSLYLFQKENK